MMQDNYRRKVMQSASNRLTSSRNHHDYVDDETVERNTNSRISAPVLSQNHNFRDFDGLLSRILKICSEHREANRQNSSLDSFRRKSDFPSKSTADYQISRRLQSQPQNYRKDLVFYNSRRYPRTFSENYRRKSKDLVSSQNLDDEKVKFLADFLSIMDSNFRENSNEEQFNHDQSSRNDLINDPEIREVFKSLLISLKRPRSLSRGDDLSEEGHSIPRPIKRKSRRSKRKKTTPFGNPNKPNNIEAIHSAVTDRNRRAKYKFSFYCSCFFLKS